MTFSTITRATTLINDGFGAFNTLIADLLSTSNGKGASQVGIEDSAGNMSADNVEDALAEIYTDHATTRTFAEIFNEKAATTTGLTWGFTGGDFRYGAVVTTVADGTVGLTDDSTNYVEIDPTDGVVKRNTTGFTVGRIPVRTVVTSSGVQTVSTDKRAWFSNTNLNIPGTIGATTPNELTCTVFTSNGIDDNADATAMTISSGEVVTFTNFPVTPSSSPTADYHVATKKYIDDLLAAGKGEATGTVKAFAGSSSSVPDGYLACLGQDVSQTTYADLYAVLDTTWNTGGESAGNFRLPPSTKFILGSDGDAGSFPPGTTGDGSGSTETRTLAANDGLPNHKHAQRGTESTPSGSSYALYLGTGNSGAFSRNGSLTTCDGSEGRLYTDTDGGDSTPIHDHDMDDYKPVYAAMLFIIKT